MKPLYILLLFVMIGISFELKAHFFEEALYVTSSSIYCSKIEKKYIPIILNTKTFDTPPDCNNLAVNGISDRISRANWYETCTTSSTWGPPIKVYEQAEYYSGCDEVSFSTARVLNAIQTIINQNYNYCHHHAPTWLPPATKDSLGKYIYRTLIDPNNIDSGTNNGACSKAYFSSNSISQAETYDAGWHGIDCTHFSSLIYNLSFGAYLATDIDEQSCDNSADSTSVSAFLPYTRDEQDKFQPGDLLFIAKDATASNFEISHVIVWTGYTIDGVKFKKEDVLKNIETDQQKYYSSAIDAILNTGKKVYIIADSHNMGPNYRPFVNWYYKAFSHARRIIGKDQFPNPLQYYPQNQQWDINGNCLVKNPYLTK